MMGKNELSRRRFLGSLGAGALGVAAGNLISNAPKTGAATSMIRLSEHLSVYRGPIQVGIVHDGDRALLIDCGDGQVADALSELGIATVDDIVFTHHHRDQACGAAIFTDQGAQLGVPKAEQAYFDRVGDYWNDPDQRWHLYYFRPHRLMLTEPVTVHRVFEDGEPFEWGPATITAIATPGHTEGSLSYLVEVDGEKTVFSGDLIYDHGRIWDLHSLQAGYTCGELDIMGYHGYLGARPALVESLRKIRSLQPTRLVPSHGNIMADPSGAVDALVQGLEDCHAKFTAISSLRYYMPATLEEFADRSDQMEIAENEPPPSCLRQIGNTWVLISQDKAAFVMDCGFDNQLEAIQKMVEDGEISAVEGLWVTHYHDDHVDALPKFQEAFDCPCHTDNAVARVITEPPAWHIPCLSPSVVRVDHITDEGESWQWREFKMTAHFLPGQTLYHTALLAEGQDMRILFIGDSFTPGGIDDYCMHNRNWLGDDVGFEQCIKLVERLEPTHLVCNHVANTFRFTSEQLEFMRKNLQERERLYNTLLPWDHPNYGLDEPWVRCYPYEQKAQPGQSVEVQVVVMNHSAQNHTLSCRTVWPKSWGDNLASRDNAWSTIEIPFKTEGRVTLMLDLPESLHSGRHVIPVDVQYGPWTLPQFAEAVIET